jgi:hypothetical protein
VLLVLRESTISSIPTEKSSKKFRWTPTHLKLFLSQREVIAFLNQQPIKNQTSYFFRNPIAVYYIKQLENNNNSKIILKSINN